MRLEHRQRPPTTTAETAAKRFLKRTDWPGTLKKCRKANNLKKSWSIAFLLPLDQQIKPRFQAATATGVGLLNGSMRLVMVL